MPVPKEKILLQSTQHFIYKHSIRSIHLHFFLSDSASKAMRTTSLHCVANWKKQIFSSFPIRSILYIYRSLSAAPPDWTDKRRRCRSFRQVCIPDYHFQTLLWCNRPSLRGGKLLRSGLTCHTRVIGGYGWSAHPKGPEGGTKFLWSASIFLRTRSIRHTTDSPGKYKQIYLYAHSFFRTQNNRKRRCHRYQLCTGRQKSPKYDCRFSGCSSLRKSGGKPAWFPLFRWLSWLFWLCCYGKLCLQGWIWSVPTHKNPKCRCLCLCFHHFWPLYPL